MVFRKLLSMLEAFYIEIKRLIDTKADASDIDAAIDEIKLMLGEGEPGTDPGTGEGGSGSGGEGSGGSGSGEGGTGGTTTPGEDTIPPTLVGKVNYLLEKYVKKTEVVDMTEEEMIALLTAVDAE